MRINYDHLVRDYYENLNTNLRNFRGGPGFLESWVHDENHNRSILGMLDLALENGINSIEILVTNDTYNQLDFMFLKDAIKKNGWLESKSSEQGVLLIFHKGMERIDDDVFASIHELYRDNLRKLFVKISHEGVIEPKDNSILLTSKDGDGTLFVEVDSNGIVVNSKHCNFPVPIKYFVEGLVSKSIGRSIQESSEHGIIRLGYALRDQNKFTHYRGLVSVERVEPNFSKINLMIRDIYRKFRNIKKSDSVPRNYWRDSLPKFWVDLNDDDRLSRIKKALIDSLKKYELQTEGIDIINIKNDTRVVLSIKQNDNFPKIGNYLIKIERELNDLIGVPLEIQLESLEDRNKRIERTNRVHVK